MRREAKKKSSSLSSAMFHQNSDIPVFQDGSLIFDSSIVKKEDFIADQKKKFLIETARNQTKSMKFLEEKARNTYQIHMMHERFPSPDILRTTRNDSAATAAATPARYKFPSRILDESILAKKQKLLNAYDNNIYAKIDAFSFNQSQLNATFKKDDVKSTPVLIDPPQEHSKLKIVPLSQGLIEQIASAGNHIHNESILSQTSNNFHNKLNSTQYLSNSKSANGLLLKLTNSQQGLSRTNSNSTLISIPQIQTNRQNPIDESKFNRTLGVSFRSGDASHRRSPSNGSQFDKSSIFTGNSIISKQSISQNHFIRGQLGKRQDAKEILVFMENKMQEMGSQVKQPISEVFVQKQNIFVSCLEELTRQISVDCREQALVLEEIWNNMMEHMGSLFQYAETAKVTSEKQFTSQITQIQNHYTDIVNTQSEKVSNLIHQVKDRNILIEKLVAENRYLRKKDKKMDKQYRLSQIEISCLQEELSDQVREHLKYLMSHEELTWREALDYQRRYYQLSQAKRPKQLKNSKHPQMDSKQQMDQHEILQKMDMDQIINEFVINPMENDLEDLIEQIEQAEDINTFAELPKNLEEDIDQNVQFLTKSKQTQTEILSFDAQTNTDTITEDPKLQISKGASINQQQEQFTQTEPKHIIMADEICTCEVQTEYTGDIRDIKIDSENWDKDASEGFFEKFNKRCAMVETETPSLRSFGVQTNYEINILLPQETEIELDSLKGNSISLELKRIVEQGIKKEHISTEDLYECKQLIEQKIELQERLVRKVKDSFVRHKKAELEKELLKDEIQLEIQFAKDQSNMQLNQLHLLTEDYKKFCNSMSRIPKTNKQILNGEAEGNVDSNSVENVSYSNINSDDQKAKDQQNQSIKPIRQPQVSYRSGGSQISNTTQKDSLFCENSFQITPAKANRKGSTSEVPHTQEHTQFKKRFSNHLVIKEAQEQQLKLKKSTSITLVPGLRTKQGFNSSTNNSDRIQIGGGPILAHRQSLPDQNEFDRSKSHQQDQSSEFLLPSQKDIEKDESYSKQSKSSQQQHSQKVIAAHVQGKPNPRYPQSTSKQDFEKHKQIPSFSYNSVGAPSAQFSTISIIPFSQLSRTYQKTSSIHTDAANNLITEVSKKFQRGEVPVLNKKKYMPFINKTLSIVYGDIIKFIKNSNALNPLHVVTYESFIHRFGLRKVAEQKMVQEVEQSMLMASEFPRLRTFVRMFYAQEGEHSTSEDKIEELKFFVNALILLDESKQSLGNFHIDRMSTSTVRVYETLPKIFAEILPEKQIIELISKLIQYPGLDVSKEAEYKRIPVPTYDKLDIDSVLDRLLEIYHNRFEILKSTYDALFKPLQLIDSIDIRDFMLLLRCVHDKDEWEFKKEINEFNRRSDQGKLNFYGFVTLCQKLGILSEIKQNEFIDEMNKAFEGQNAVMQVKDVDLYLADVWPEEKARLKLVLSANRAYTDSHKKLCDIIDLYLSKEEYYEAIYPKQVFSAYKILQKSVQITFIKSFTADFMGNELSLINSMMRNFTFFGKNNLNSQQQIQTSTTLTQFLEKDNQASS